MYQRSNVVSDTAPIVSRPRTDIPVSQRIDTISKHKMNGKNILNNNPPPNSVLIVPQFQFHERMATKTEVAYMKPKLSGPTFQPLLQRQCLTILF